MMTQGVKEATTSNSVGGESKITMDGEGQSNIGTEGQMKGREREKMSFKRSYSVEVSKIKTPEYILNICA